MIGLIGKEIADVDEVPCRGERTGHVIIRFTDGSAVEIHPFGYECEGVSIQEIDS